MSEMRDVRDDKMEDPTSRDDVRDAETAPMDGETTTDRDTRMGRDRTADDERAMEREPVRASDSRRMNQTEMWPDMGDLRQRFDTIQSEFIDDPREAVKKAESLINDVVERITRSMHERIDSMHSDTDGKNDTEQLRLTMRGYRDLVDWMETRRAA